MYKAYPPEIAPDEDESPWEAYGAFLNSKSKNLFFNLNDSKTE